MKGLSKNVTAAAALSAVLSLGAAPGGHELAHVQGAGVSERPAYDPSHLSAVCPRGTLPDGDACIHFPAADRGDDGFVGGRSAADDGAPLSESSVNTHRDSLGRWVVYDEIPRRPDRPAEYDAYRYPVPCEENACVVSGYDLDRSDEQQRRGARLRQVGHGAVDLLAPRGTPIHLVPLEHQEGPAEVVFAGTLFGITVVTRHTVREAGRLRDYLVLFGHMDSASPGAGVGTLLNDGDLVGTVGDTGSPGRVHLHLETRRLRDGVDAAKLAPSALANSANSIVCDPRNVLPLR
jgi:murein DD-endopeptidase MepM/ murein hydrolase activator NlpD